MRLWARTLTTTELECVHLLECVFRRLSGTMDDTSVVIRSAHSHEQRIKFNVIVLAPASSRKRDCYFF